MEDIQGVNSEINMLNETAKTTNMEHEKEKEAWKKTKVIMK
jgi:hypothetical protein